MRTIDQSANVAVELLALSRGRCVALALLLMISCGKTASDSTTVGGGGGVNDATSGGGTAGDGGMTDGGETGDAVADVADSADACGDFGAYANVCKCPGANCGPSGYGTWYCATTPCDDGCPLPAFKPGEACAVGRACVKLPFDGCGELLCLCAESGWHCGGWAVCDPACQQVMPGKPCSKPGTVCGQDAIRCTCVDSAWSCEVLTDAG